MEYCLCKRRTRAPTALYICMPPVEILRAARYLWGFPADSIIIRVVGEFDNA